MIPGLGEVISGTFTDRSSIIVDRWQAGYDLIQRCNHAIAHIQPMTIDKAKQEGFIAEAKFLRALMYFQLTNLYGALPIYDETVDLNKDFADLKNSRSSVEDVNKFILNDLNYAIEKLPVSYDAKYYGRVTKGAAYALRGK
jgi:hypothetical protein